MDFKDFKQNFLIDKTFLIIVLMLNGFTGLIFLSFLSGQTIFNLVFSNFFIFFVLLIIEFIWFSYAIFSKIIKKSLTKKDFFTILITIPLYAISFMGQLGNSGAFSVLFGNLGADLYNSYIVIMHMLLLYKIIKEAKK